MNCLYFGACFLLVIYHGNTCTGWLFSFSEDKYRSVCYDPLGCFNTSYPYDNTEIYLPESPDDLDVGFHVFGHGNVSIRVTWNVSAPNLSDLININNPTKILIHGFHDHGRTDWMIKMVTAFIISEEPMNLLTLDWSKGASNIIYTQVVANTRLVGRIGAEFIKTLVNIGVQPTDLHLIGHSLGAHIAGYIGSELKSHNIDVFRISGLDPASPLYEGSHTLVRLDVTDAIFVDVAHSSTEPIIDVGGGVGIGILERCGTVDFYPNGGRYQPGCAISFIDRLVGLALQGTPDVKALKRTFGCSHVRVLDLYTESINSECRYNMNFCWTVDDITPESCSSCNNMHCPMFGYRAIESGFAGIFFFETNSESPFC